MVREVLPNILMPMLYLALIGISLVIVAEATLAVLGLGIINKISWGGMIVDGIDGFAENPHVVFIPCLAIFLVVLPLNFLGERLRVLTDARESAL